MTDVTREVVSTPEGAAIPDGRGARSGVSTPTQGAARGEAADRAGGIAAHLGRGLAPYEVHEREELVLVVRIGPRGEVCERL